jgi:uncharacterized OB-fold protein
MTDKPVPDVTERNRIYFEGCAKGELRLRRCLKCAARFRFAFDWCPQCWSLDLAWEKACGLGKVSHYSVVHVAPSDAFETPYVLALIELDEGVRMMSNVQCDPDEVRIGLPVKVTFEKRGEVSLPMFVPAE